MPKHLIVTRPGASVELDIPTEEIASNILDNICEAPDLDAVKAKREGNILDGVIAGIIEEHLKTALTLPYKRAGVPTHQTPTCESRDLPM